MAYKKPQVLVYQEFTETVSPEDTTLRAWVVGQNADIHERGELPIVGGTVTEPPEYNAGEELTVPYTNRAAGSVIDEESVHVYADAAILQYAELEAADPAENGKYAYADVTEPNQLLFNNFIVKETAAAARDSELGERDVLPGDTVRVTGYAAAISGSTACNNVSFDTTVVDYVVDVDDGYPYTPIRKTGKVGTQTVTCSLDGISGLTYTGPLGSEEYTIHVQNGNYRVDSASDTDNYPAAFTQIPTVTADGVEKYKFTIGRNGVIVTVPVADYPSIEEVGIFTVEVQGGSQTVSADSERYVLQNDGIHTSAGAALTLKSVNGGYSPLETGFVDQKCLISCISKRTTAACTNAEFRVIMSSGLGNQYAVQALLNSESVWEFNVTPDGTVVASFTAEDFEKLEVGDAWLYLFKGNYAPCDAVLADGVIYEGETDDVYVITCTDGGTVGDSVGLNTPVIAYQTLSGSEYRKDIPITSTASVVTTSTGLKFRFTAGDLILGETYLIRVTTGRNAAVRGLVLRDSLPWELLTASADAPAEDRTALSVQFCVTGGADITSGAALGTDAVTVPAVCKTEKDGLDVTLLSGEISVAYREWVAEGVGKIQTVANSAELDLLPGPLVPENPLKYALYKALSNSGGVAVAYTNVQDDTADSWLDAFNLGLGRTDVYALVPLTQDPAIQNLAVSVVEQDSNETTCAWKICYLNQKLPAEVCRIGREVSLDGKTVQGTLAPTGIIRWTSLMDNNLANLDASLVVPGDTLKIFTGVGYETFTVESVVGQSIKVANPNEVLISTPSVIEVWHTYTRPEQAQWLADRAQSFSSRRVCLIWPDAAMEGAYTLPGMMVCAAVAGLMSGSLPHQGLTRVAINGFDGVKEYFTETELNEIAGSGVWVVTEDIDGTIYTRHACTTSTLGLLYSEEMVTRNIDDISFKARSILDPYIGRTNVTAETLEDIRIKMTYYLDGISASNYSAIGPQIIEYEILDIAQDVLLQDRINVVIQAVVPKALNIIVLRIQAS